MDGSPAFLVLLTMFVGSLCVLPNRRKPFAEDGGLGL